METEDKRDPTLPPPPLPPPLFRVTPINVSLSGIAGGPEIEKPFNRSGVLQESGFDGGGNFSMWARPSVSPGVVRVDPGQSSGKSGEIHGHPSGNTFGNNVFQKLGSDFYNESYASPGPVSGGAGVNNPIAIGSVGTGSHTGARTSAAV